MGTGTEHGPTVGSPAAGVVHSLHERRQTLATVESLTGGLLAAAIVEIAGVSAVYRGGLVTYATELKARLADVPEELLAERGPVDPDVAVALAEGAGGAAPPTGGWPPPGSPVPSRRTADRSAWSMSRWPGRAARWSVGWTSTGAATASGRPR